MTVVLRTQRGTVRPMAAQAWHDPATVAERALLARLAGPVLDLGCGPGRLVAAACELGVPALGVDASPWAVSHARSEGLPVLHRSLFDPLPAEGRWRTVLLWDGNVGIGGRPVALLERAGDLLAEGGVVLVEVDPPDAGSGHDHARIEHHGEVSAWFPWAWVSADAIDDVAAQAGLVRDRWWRAEDRWFALLRRGSAPCAAGGTR